MLCTVKEFIILLIYPIQTYQGSSVKKIHMNPVLMMNKLIYTDQEGGRVEVMLRVHTNMIWDNQ